MTLRRMLDRHLAACRTVALFMHGSRALSVAVARRIAKRIK